MDFISQLLQLQPELTRHTQFLTHNTQDAQDIAQDTLYLAIKYKDRYEERNALKAWVFTIANNVYIQRAKNAAREQVQDVPQQKTTHTTIDETDTYLSKLPKKIRETFCMFMDGYKYREIAVCFGIPIGTVKFRIAKARSILKKIYPVAQTK